jgi:YD repeat-containing protein
MPSHPIQDARTFRPIALAALLLALLAAHGLAQVTTVTAGLKGDVATLREFHAFAFEERRLVGERAFGPSGAATEHVVYTYAVGDGSLRERHVTSFDGEGRRLATVVYGADGEARAQTVFTYDAAGRQVSEFVLDANGIETRRTDVERDVAGNAVLELRYRGGTPTQRSERSFDPQGRLLELRQYDAEGRLVEVRTTADAGGDTSYLRYAADGSVEERGSLREGPFGSVSAVVQDADGAMIYEVHLAYDEDGRQVERRDVEADGATMVTTMVYELDAMGNWVRQSTFEDSGDGPELYEVREREISYR